MTVRRQGSVVYTNEVSDAVTKLHRGTVELLEKEVRVAGGKLYRGIPNCMLSPLIKTPCCVIGNLTGDSPSEGGYMGRGSGSVAVYIVPSTLFADSISKETEDYLKLAGFAEVLLVYMLDKAIKYISFSETEKWFTTDKSMYLPSCDTKLNVANIFNYRGELEEIYHLSFITWRKEAFKLLNKQDLADYSEQVKTLVSSDNLTPEIHSKEYGVIKRNLLEALAGQAVSIEETAVLDLEGLKVHPTVIVTGASDHKCAIEIVEHIHFIEEKDAHITDRRRVYTALGISKVIFISASTLVVLEVPALDLVPSRMGVRGVRGKVMHLTGRYLKTNDLFSGVRGQRRCRPLSLQD